MRPFQPSCHLKAISFVILDYVYAQVCGSTVQKSIVNIHWKHNLQRTSHELWSHLAHVETQLLWRNAQHCSHKATGDIDRHNLLISTLGTNNGLADQTLLHNLRRQEYFYWTGATTWKWMHNDCINSIVELHLFNFKLKEGSFLTLGESEDPDNTMSTEYPGKSSTREGLRLKTVFSLSRDPSPKVSFLEVEIGGKIVRPDKSPTLLCWDPSIRQYNRCVRRPWLVSLK